MGWTIKNAVETAKAAEKWSGEKNLSYRTYKQYKKEFGGPSIGFILGRMKWTEFKEKYLGIKRVKPRERMENKLEENFCGLCKEKDNCEIKLEDCDHWKYWKNQRNTG